MTIYIQLFDQHEIMVLHAREFNKPQNTNLVYPLITTSPTNNKNRMGSHFTVEL